MANTFTGKIKLIPLNKKHVFSLTYLIGEVSCSFRDVPNQE